MSGAKAPVPGSSTTSRACVASNGVVWVADSNNNRIETYDPRSDKFAVYGSKGSGACQFNHREAVAVSPGGRVHVADTLNNRIVR